MSEQLTVAFSNFEIINAETLGAPTFDGGESLLTAYSTPLISVVSAL